MQKDLQSCRSFCSFFAVIGTLERLQAFKVDQQGGGDEGVDLRRGRERKALGKSAQQAPLLGEGAAKLPAQVRNRQEIAVGEGACAPLVEEDLSREVDVGQAVKTAGERPVAVEQAATSRIEQGAGGGLLLRQRTLLFGQPMEEEGVVEAGPALPQARQDRPHLRQDRLAGCPRQPVESLPQQESIEQGDVEEPPAALGAAATAAELRSYKGKGTGEPGVDGGQQLPVLMQDLVHGRRGAGPLSASSSPSAPSWP